MTAIGATTQLLSEVPTSKPIAESRAARRTRWAARREYWSPWFFGGAAAIAAYFLSPADDDLFRALRGCLGSAVDAAAILAGFQGTGLSLLLALLSTAPVNALRRMKTFPKLVAYHWHAILAMLAVVGVSMGLLAFQGVGSSFGIFTRWVCAGVTFVAVSAALAAFRVTYLMVTLLKSPKLHAELPAVADRGGG